MKGAIAGDVIGSVYERTNIKTTDFPLFSPNSRFTDDTVLTVAIAHALLDKTGYGEKLRSYGQKYPAAGYGGAFRNWIYSNGEPYNSWGNGSAMRVSPIGFAFDNLEDVLNEAKKCAAVTHNHPEGIKGAQAVALAIFLARNGESKDGIKRELESRFGYNLSRSLSEIRPDYKFDVSCQGSVPESIIAFLESKDYEDAVRNAISIGGDSDTIACIAGSIAQAYYPYIPSCIISEIRQRLPGDLWEIVERFDSVFRPTFDRFKGTQNNLGGFYEAYLKTQYVIKDENLNCTLRVGELSPIMEDLFSIHNLASGAFLTAFNPRSKELGQIENEERQRDLVSLVKTQGYQYFSGFGQGEIGNWTPEPSIFVLGIDFSGAYEIANRFEQSAFVYVDKGRAPMLICSA